MPLLKSLKDRGITMAMQGVSTKVAAATGAAAVTTLIVWAVSYFGVEVPNDVQGAFTVLIVLVAGYFVPERAEQGDHEA